MAARAVVGALPIAVGAALIVTLLTLASLLRASTYEPSAQVSVELQNLPPPGEGLQTPTQAMIHATGSPPVAKETIGRLGLEMSPAELLDNLTVEQAESKTFIVLTYQGTDRVKATQIVNTLAKVASERISEISAAREAGTLRATVYEEARVPKPPPDPKPLRNGLLTLVMVWAMVWALYAGLTLTLLAVLRPVQPLGRGR
jgi:capsular polysaccharide biosynthesis protein